MTSETDIQLELREPGVRGDKLGPVESRWIGEGGAGDGMPREHADEPDCCCTKKKICIVVVVAVILIAAAAVAVALYIVREYLTFYRQL